jgi:hypothetical protein
MSLISLLQFPSTLRKLTRPIENARRTGDAVPFNWVWEERADQYAMNVAMLENTIYGLQNDGGFREEILERLFKIAGTNDVTNAVRLAGHYNPIRGIVDAYQNVFRGNFGQEIRIADEVNGRPVNPKLVEAIGKVWQWSNLDTNKQLMQEWAANLGTVGLRIVAKADPDPANRRVSIQLDHPATIVDFDEDDRGNVQQVLIKYKAIAGPLGAKRRDVDVEELIGKDEFKQSQNGRITTSDNQLGVCPYVIPRHRDDGHEFGAWAYRGSEDIVHAINWIISNQNDSIVEHNWPTWFASAGGKAPSQFEFGRAKVAYVQTVEGTPPPSLEPLVAHLDQGSAREQWQALIEQLIERQPELVIGHIKSLSGQSGETIAKLLIPSEAKIEAAKAMYEHAVKRALQLAVSEMIRLGLVDLGTGTGTPDAADRAYRSGAEDFDFAPRRPLPATVYDLIQQHNAEQVPKANKLDLMSKAESVTNLSGKEVLRQGGYTDAEIKKIEAEKAKENADAGSADGTDTLDGTDGQNP